MRVLVVDIGGINLKILASGRTEPRKPRRPVTAKSTPRRKAAGEALKVASR